MSLVAAKFPPWPTHLPRGADYYLDLVVNVVNGINVYGWLNENMNNTTAATPVLGSGSSGPEL
jgi:hypothetical protein